MTLTREQIASLKTQYAGLSSCPTAHAQRMLAQCSDDTVNELASADIKFLSKLAKTAAYQRRPRGPVHTCSTPGSEGRYCAACGR